MNRSHLLLSVFLLASLTLNVWQFLRPAAAFEAISVRSIVPAATSAKHSMPRGSAAPSQGKPTDFPETAVQETAASTEPPLSGDPSLLIEEELVFGQPRPGKTLAGANPKTKVTPERLRAIAKEKPSDAAKFSVHAVIILPGDRPLDLGTVEVEPGAPLKLEKTKEFPYPASISFARPDPPAGGSIFPVTPTTPGSFETMNTGIELDLDVTPAPGTIVLGGVLTHRVFDGFGRMPGEVFSPIVTTGVSESGKPVEVTLTDNKMLQPQFRMTECPIIAATAAGQTVRVPVSMAFGQTFLDLTCTPVN